MFFINLKKMIKNYQQFSPPYILHNVRNSRHTVYLSLQSTSVWFLHKLINPKRFSEFTEKTVVPYPRICQYAD